MPMTESLWALPPEQAESVLSAIARELRRPDGDAGSAAIPSIVTEETDKGYAVINGVAVIPVSGPIARQTTYSFWSGRALTIGHDAISAAIDAALVDTSAKAILFSFNSPGGVVHGTKELADKISAAATKKPMAAYADGLMASAAMWLGAATGRVYAPATASVGSIGVVMVHTDYSRINERFGVSVTYITGGKFKSAGNPDQPLSDEARDLFQKQVSGIHEIFKADVVRGLGVTAPSDQWAEGQTMLAGEAQRLGLVTTIVQDIESAINALNQEITMDYATLAAQHPDLLAEIENKAKAQALAEHQAQAGQAVSTERDAALAMVRAVAGDDAADRIKTLMDSGITAEQVKIMASVMAVPPASAAPSQKSGTNEKILAALQQASAGVVEGGIPPSAEPKRSKLVADAERRAATA
ncbi:S49 family peptidase [Desulfosarcina sp. OttesenSCG-928-A07]|nr:S49 family peptidase [Desulfosarcina sp. OttesenSCG-928-G17]MDL2329078.1 S49 family peptidase [Desulfosarcina sp. OttesenSCG-928-A07]